MDSLKIATFNINGIRARRLNLLEWLEGEQPDGVCLQGLEAQGRGFPIAGILAWAEALERRGDPLAR